MTSYNDVPQVTALHAEQERVASAIAMLEAGGTMPSFMVAMPPPPPDTIPSEMPPMPVTITVPNMIGKQLRRDLLAELRARQDELAQQLADLGVTDVKTVEVET
jgi:hypothetical protein